LNIENVLLQWVNRIVKLHVDEYGCISDEKDAKFESISRRVKESISLERRKAVIGQVTCKEEVKEEVK
jgi:hypothetical protein